MRVPFRRLMMAAIASWAPATARAEDVRDRLVDFAMIEVTHDLCQFDLSDAQQDAITKARNKLIDDGAVTEAEVSEIRDSIAQSMTRQVPEGLCRPDGAQARFYKRKLAELGAP